MLEDMENTSQQSAAAPQAHEHPAPNPTELMRSLMRYKRWADADLLDTALALPALATRLEGQYVTAIVRHFHTVDCIFRAHLLGTSHGYTSPNPTDPVLLSDLRPRVAATDEWFVDYACRLAPRELGEALQVTFTDGQRQVLTRSDILLHVSLHGTAHRGQIGLLLRQCGAEPPPDRFTNYVRERDDRAFARRG